jgi:hypothetical protein
MSNGIQIGLNQTFTGYYKVGVVDPKTDSVEWKSEGKNLILNQGMDNLYAMSVADQTAYGICGVGTRPNSIDGGSSQISQSGTVIHLSDTSGAVKDFTSSFDAYSNTCQVGDVIAFANGSQSLIQTVTNGFNLTVTPSYTFVQSQSFVVWKTSQIGLQSEISRSTSYLTGNGNCGSTFNNLGSGSIIHRRTYDFPNILQQMSYNEIGVGWTSSGATKVFSRILINPVIVFAGFRLRIVYDLQTQYTPTGSIFGAASIGGWPVSPATTTNGTQSVQKFLCSYIDTNGASQNTDAALDPYYLSSLPSYWSIWLSTNSSSLGTFGNAVDRTVGSYATSGANQGSLAAYSLLNFFCDKTGTVLAGAAATDHVRSIGFGVEGSGKNPANSTNQAFAFVFDQAQTILSTQTLSMTFRYVWSRTLG